MCSRLGDCFKLTGGGLLADRRGVSCRKMGIRRRKYALRGMRRRQWREAEDGVSGDDRRAFAMQKRRSRNRRGWAAYGAPRNHQPSHCLGDKPMR